ncbi:tRNA (uridine(34)/cytosine(34)/5-carboxymethylaminomethyluridine(34)-2'-O)-methyltransferase TrmL [Bacillus timonensis]|uniref:tRNA (uridine(34)/cytosine(34)/5- carboxymethylaminomethyluridine(34)-2'-O)- methyltransferase TrmL n=1 Tax=Bacillus timonensis TaxID=1033734 RepID=UPI0002886E49|nr:tRNA (uridine(34)/cytosine(34)/5-carboxymethylaminomethyluridine(34)-2'-O)-methyltransferase TrmL [Bacillus timonensis]
MGLHVVLYQPELPANTGNIARTCAATDTTLHLIRPLGFSTDDKMLKRAGLDYWEFVKIHSYGSIQDLFDKYQDGEFYLITNYGKRTYSSADFRDLRKDHFLIFGSETTGLPMDLIENNIDRTFRLPMTENVGSLNLSNTAAILVYEALRQQNYPELT